MIATQTHVQQFISSHNTRFIIPVYQRNYDWKQDQCQELLNDILYAGKERSVNVHFIGSIVYIHDSVLMATGMKELVVIDGQQRLTTLTLVYLAIYKLALEMDNHELAQEINETYLINKFSPVSERLKLKPNQQNSRALEFIFNCQEDEVFQEYSRFIENYEFFRSCIGINNYEQVLQGLRKLVFVEISLDQNNDNPQRIFESLNSTGLELSQADLIRNYILMGLKPEEQDIVYNRYWSSIEKYAKNEINNNDLVSDFIRDYLTLKNKKIPNKKSVYQEFKISFPYTTTSQLEKDLQNIKRLVVHYNKIVNPIKEQNLIVREQLEYISQLEINVSFPFLIQVYDDYSNNVIDQEVFVDVLKLIQNFTWRRFIVGLPTNALNKIFMSLYDKVDHDKYLESIQLALISRLGNQRFPRDKEVIDALKIKDVYNISNKNRIYLLERLEHYNNMERIQVSGNSAITTEHIFPQTPNKSWKETISLEDYNALKTTYLHTLANLTLSGNNAQLGNRSFIEKRDLPEAGYKASNLWLNRHLAELGEWNLVELQKRYHILSERFLAIWPFPDVVEPIVNNEIQELSIFEAEEPQGRRIDYIIFKNKKLSFGTITDLYLYILKSLFEMQPEAFYTSGLYSRINLVKGEGNTIEFTAPRAITGDYFVETNLNSNTKFRRLKDALEVFGFEEELIIKYAD